jgi:hypothetical protein
MFKTPVCGTQAPILAESIGIDSFDRQRGTTKKERNEKSVKS